MSGKVSRGLSATAILLSVAVTPVAHAVSDDVAIQLLERLGELEKEVGSLRGENEILRNELQNIKSDQQEHLPAGGQEAAVPASTLVPPVDTSPLPALEDPVASVPPVIVPQVMSETISAPVSDPEDRKAVAPVVEFNAGSGADKKVDPKSPESYYYYGTEDEDQPEQNTITTPVPAQNTPVVVNPVVGTADATATTQTVVTRAIPDAHKAKAEYNEAYKALVNDPHTAVPAFRDFLTKYPNHELAANAQYWLGEALYAQKDYSGATEEFMVVLKQHKKSSKAPGAALKLGYSFYELRQWDFARRTLEDTIRFFPDSNAAVLARQRLDKMTAEGH